MTHRKIKNIITAVFCLAMTITLSACQNPLDNIFNSSETTEAVSETPEQTAAENTDITAASSEEAESETESVTSAESVTSEEFDETGGGNPDTYKEIEITVSENQYFYNNHEITFDEFTDLLKDADVNTTIRLSDEMASDSAFSKITDYLDEQNIPYITE